MIAILGEDDSDCEFLRTLTRRISSKKDLKIAIKGFCGDTNLFREGARKVSALRAYGYHNFVVCVDADGKPPEERRKKVEAKVLVAGGLTTADLKKCCILVPVQMIEAWILADASSIRKKYTTLRLDDVPNPESIADPKKRLRSLSHKAYGRPRYTPATHNPAIAEVLDCTKVERTCPSFRCFTEFARRAA